MEVQLFAEGVWQQTSRALQFTRGVSIYPLPRQSVYLLTCAEVVDLYKSAEGHRPPDEVTPLVPFAKYVGAESANCRANIDKMFGMHCVVLGSTGSGKSGAVAALLHSILEHKVAGDNYCQPRIVMIDPHGEYGRTFGSRAVVYRAYDPIGREQEGGLRIKLPYWLMSAAEFRSLVTGKTEVEATWQSNIIYKAITHARMVAAGLVEPAPSCLGSSAPANGAAIDTPSPCYGVTPDKLAMFDPDKPRPFCLDELVKHITYVQAARVKNGVTEQVPPAEFSSNFKSLLDKLAVLRRDPRISFLMSNWTADAPTVPVLLAQFVGEPLADPVTDDRLSQDIRLIDISGLPNEVAGPLAAMLARLLFQYKLYQSEVERAKDPLLLVCEEAHRYVPDRGDAEYGAAQMAIRRIAREGRKYGLGLMLVSQRPADIDSTVISQCGTWLILRLTNQADQQHVARFLPDGLSGMTKLLSNLAQQEAIFVGEGAALPARVRIRNLTNEQLPRSESVKFIAGWAGSGLTSDELNEVAKRMTE